MTRLAGAAIIPSAVLIAATAPLALGASEDFALAVFPPWWSPQQAVLAAARAGEIVSAQGGSTTVVVHGAPETLASSLRDAGAILVVGAPKGTRCLTAAR